MVTCLRRISQIKGLTHQSPQCETAQIPVASSKAERTKHPAWVLQLAQNGLSWQERHLQGCYNILS